MLLIRLHGIHQSLHLVFLPIALELPVPSGAAIIMVAGLAFALAAIARGTLPSLKGNLG